jgi:hypothetical protein
MTTIDNTRMSETAESPRPEKLVNVEQWLLDAREEYQEYCRNRQLAQEALRREQEALAQEEWAWWFMKRWSKMAPDVMWNPERRPELFEGKWLHFTGIGWSPRITGDYGLDCIIEMLEKETARIIELKLAISNLNIVVAPLVKERGCVSAAEVERRLELSVSEQRKAFLFRVLSSARGTDPECSMDITFANNEWTMPPNPLSSTIFIMVTQPILILLPYLGVIMVSLYEAKSLYALELTRRSVSH